MEECEAINNCFIDHFRLNGSTRTISKLVELNEVFSHLDQNSSWTVSLIRDLDRDAMMEMDCVNGLTSIRGMEDSVERGSFGFMLVGPIRSSEAVDFFGYSWPRYSAIGFDDGVKQIALYYAKSGQLSPEYRWHVATTGLGRDFATIPKQEIFGGVESISLMQFLRDREIAP